jgi:hypothetical protein
MSSPSSPGGSYEVHNSGQIAQAFLQLQRQASREGRGQALLQATREVYKRLTSDPKEFGEPLYRLPNLRMQVRTVLIRPLNVDYAVCEDRPLVFIKAVRLLSRGRD